MNNLKKVPIEKMVEYKEDVPPPMMKCGHTGFALVHLGGKQYWCCVICECYEPVETPNLTGRKARCDYFGKKTHRSECDACRTFDDGLCHCEEPSASGLAFFQYRPDKEFDEFYCGCHGWD